MMIINPFAIISILFTLIITYYLIKWSLALAIFFVGTILTLMAFVLLPVLVIPILIVFLPLIIILKLIF